MRIYIRALNVIVFFSNQNQQNISFSFWWWIVKTLFGILSSFTYIIIIAVVIHKKVKFWLDFCMIKFTLFSNASFHLIVWDSDFEFTSIHFKVQWIHLFHLTFEISRMRLGRANKCRYNISFFHVLWMRMYKEKRLRGKYVGALPWQSFRLLVYLNVCWGRCWLITCWTIY